MHDGTTRRDTTIGPIGAVLSGHGESRRVLDARHDEQWRKTGVCAAYAGPEKDEGAG